MAQEEKRPLRIPGTGDAEQQQQQPQSFSDAFSFVKQGAFYAAPPAPSSSSSSQAGPGMKPAPATVPVNSRNAILVSRRQQGNPVLKFIRNVKWTFADIVPDYLLGQTSCALYLRCVRPHQLLLYHQWHFDVCSIRYHLLHPDYLYFRIRELQKDFRLRVVLCYVDVEDVIKPLHEVTKTALLHDCSLLCAWSLEECARYLETIKMYENKPADSIQERTDQDYLSRLTSALTTVRHVNKTDVATLGSTFGSMASVMSASMEELARCPGIGERKVRRLYDTFHEPFRRTSKQLRLSSVGIKPTGGENATKAVEDETVNKEETRKTTTEDVK